MAVTHADLEPRTSKTNLSCIRGAFFVITILLGLLCFILCLKAEATRSKLTWIDEKEKGDKSECVYNGNGKVPLLCAVSAIVGLAIALVMEHAYMLIEVNKSSPSLLNLDPDSPFAKSLTLPGVFYITTWICFAVAEILLLVGLIVESGHLKNWSKPRTDCYTMKEGLFSAAGVLSLTTIFLIVGLYLTTLRAQRMLEVEIYRREVLEASTLYASTPRSLQRHITSVARENPTTIESQNDQLLLYVFPTPFNKSYTFV
ncbi:protein MODIFYING WALL LIGNIN-1-like [Trifolium pratense]|uniref:protein MODIFYING WALL LIGNIN-1-like n=1 Tax=Trifolium pratense TaxID=57577 RepID=UPI001E695935|nr:protein MODIFYING WALL LIGNIN-1-like [Trifolium pratense]